MNTIHRLLNETILRRTRYKALCNGKRIDGCGECDNNKEFPGLMKTAPIHRCLASIDKTGMNNAIWDPNNIPEWCPFKIVPIEGLTQ